MKSVKLISKTIYLACIIFLIISGACSENNPVQTIYLVRHAEKVLTDSSDNPPLLPAGKERAGRLKEIMLSEQKQITSIYSTRFTRNTETVKPLADALNLPIELYEWHDWKPMLNQIRKQKKGNFLICGHGDNLLPMIEYLGGERPLEKLGDTEYDKIFKIFLRGEKVQVQVSSY